MKRSIMSWFGRRAMARLVFGAGLVCSAAVAVHARWYFEVGPMYRGDMDIAVQGGSRAADSGLHAGRDGTTGGMPVLGGNLLNDDGTAQVLRQFDDGYVGPSGWAWARDAGWTQHWAYQDPAQYDAAADTLTFQITLGESVSQRRTRTRSWTESAGWTGSRRTDGFGAMATLGYVLRQEDTWSLAAQARLGWLDGIRGNFRDRPAFRQGTERTVYETTLRGTEVATYTYDTLGNPAFPAAPYAMVDPTGVGPMIGDVPQSIERTGQAGTPSERVVRRSTGMSVSTVDLSVEAQAFTLQLGPRVLWQSTGRFALLLQPAVTLNLLDADVRRSETLRRPDGAVVATWNDSADKQLWRTGAGVQAGAQMALSERWNLTALGGYEWVDKYSFSAGPDRIRIDLSGWQLELALARAF